LKITYSKHLEQRLSLRGIDYNLPKRVFLESHDKYIDLENGHFIAVMQVELYNKPREVMTAYVAEEDIARLLTIHPLKMGQKENRIKSGRWRRLE